MSIFPLTIGPTGRYVVAQGGEPFLVHGDAAWSLASALSREEAVHYMDDRASRGVNAVIVDLVEKLLAPNAPGNAYGVDPFTTPGDLGTPNPAYFEHVDWLFGKQNGAAYWSSRFRATSVTRIRAFPL